MVDPGMKISWPDENDPESTMWINDSWGRYVILSQAQMHELRRLLRDR